MAAAIGLLIRFVVAAVAATLAYWSFRSNADFWRHTFAANVEVQSFYVALSYAAGGAKYGLAVYAEYFNVRLRDNRPYLLVFVVALAFDMLSGIGYASLSRAEISRETDDLVIRRAAISEKIERLESRLSTITPGRVAAVVRIERESQAKLGRCESRSEARSDRCRKLAMLDAELADSSARESIFAELDALQTALADLPAPREADPQAAAVAGALNAALALVPGAPAVSNASAKWGLALLLVLFIELGPITCARAAIAVRPLPALPQPPAPRPRPKILAAPAPGNDETPAPAFEPCRPTLVRSQPKDRIDLLAALRQADAGGPCPAWLHRADDGWLYLSQSEAALAAGVSKPTIGRRLRALETAGEAKMAVTSRGTGIKLLHPSKSPETARGLGQNRPIADPGSKTKTDAPPGLLRVIA